MNVTPGTTTRKVREKNGVILEEVEVQDDTFKSLLVEDGFAQVSCSLTKGIEFNSEKVTFFVGVKCDQNQKTLDAAAKLVFEKALEYVAEAANVLGWTKKE